MKKLFTERHGQSPPRVAEVLDDTTRNGLLMLTTARIDEEWFGLSFNDKCDDGYAYAGTDVTRLHESMNGHGLLWPCRVPPDSEQSISKRCSGHKSA